MYIYILYDFVFKELNTKNRNKDVKLKRNKMQIDFITQLMDIYHDENPISDKSL